MPLDMIVTPAMRALYDPDRGPEVGYPGSNMNPELTGVGPRLAWMHQQGIDLENVISGTAYTLARAIADPALGMETLEAINTWMTDRLVEAKGRLMLAANLRFEDLDWAIAELERMRGRGCRTFLFPSEPTGDVPPNHRDYDRLWSAVTDLAMVPIVHVGSARRATIPRGPTPRPGNDQEHRRLAAISTGLGVPQCDGAGWCVRAPPHAHCRLRRTWD